jgi:ABC-type transport system substrate-binding protein
LITAVVALGGSVGATPPLTNGQTLIVSVPGPFTGCSALSPELNASTNALLDLTLPSAFVTSAKDVPRGGNGAIESAELVSIKPMTAVYSLDTTQHWSNGQAFTGADLVAWWQTARHSPSLAGVGYRDIRSISVANHGSQVTAVFSRPFAPWNTLFRDVQERGDSWRGCSIDRLKSRPSLGPYEVVSDSPHRVILQANPNWEYTVDRFKTVILTTSRTIPRPSVPFVAYIPAAQKASVDNLANHATILGHIGATDSLVELQFNTRSALMTSVAARRAFSWLLDRRQMLKDLFGSFTVTATIAPSLLYAQNQQNAPVAPHTTEVDKGPVSPSDDCRECALTWFANHGYSVSPDNQLLRDGKPIRLSIVHGPSALDTATAAIVAHQWSSYGLIVTQSVALSDQVASQVVANGSAQVAVFTRPMGMSPWFAAASFLDINSSDAFATRLHVPGLAAIVAQALENFNPISAASTWAAVDQMLMNTYAVRPLFTPPSLTELSPTLSNESNSLTLTGLLDQITTWAFNQRQ